MSGKKKRESFAQSLSRLLGESLSPEELAGLESASLDGAAELGKLTRDEAMALALIGKALKGDLAAVKFIREAAAESEGTAERDFKLTLVVRRPGDGA
ncbi:MAG: hypothetical protein Q4B42_04945 [Oscillospiraceae bacterium]|nr:hypothetical protein [Oscillospiraceae bacterium]